MMRYVPDCGFGFVLPCSRNENHLALAPSFMTEFHSKAERFHYYLSLKLN